MPTGWWTVPIPDDAKVVSPSAALPEIQWPFLGAWVGRWGGALKHILIVESVQPDGSASVIYGWEDSPGLSITRGFSRLGANLSGDTLTIESSFTATYKLTSATSATGSYRRGDSRAQADIVKADLAALIASVKKFAESIMISTKLQENAKPVRLEVVIDKPPGDGPFPLLVVNHGSTGRGNNAALFTQTFSNSAFAEMFVEKGYMVAFPQRRGRGKSEGLTTKDSTSTAIKVTRATRSSPCPAPTAR